MIPVRPLGFCVVSINNLTRSCCRLNTASGFPFRRWQSQSASLGIIHDCNAENIPGRGLAPALDNFHLHPEKQRSFSIISDHYEPSNSRRWVKKLPYRSLAYEKPQLLVLLVTPSYVRILAEGNRFIPDLLRQTYRGWVKGRTVDVLVAVVDRISLPASSIKKADTLALTERVVDYSGKGISVLLTDSETAAPDLWSQHESRQQEAASTKRRRSTLSFQFGPNKEPVYVAEQSAENKSFQSKTIKLPVANTVFHNGRESTIQAQRWIVGETMLEPTLACIKRSWLHEQVLRVAFPFPPEPDKFPLQVFIPLSRICSRQRVATSMGNVISQLHSLEDTSQPNELNFRSEAEPASKQLEHAVTRWITRPGKETRTVEVWALVRPPTALQRVRHMTFSKDIKAGGHLHRVLSGGGGWGNRQGLLALDPEVDIDVSPELTMAQGFDNGSPEARGNASNQIVNTGDILEFFARYPIESSSAAHPNATTSFILSCSPCLVFGTTPSTVDAMPEPHSTTQPALSSSDCIFVRRHFGMLSEQGVSLTTVSIDGELSQTKIDAPHALLSCGIAGQHISPLEIESSPESKRAQKPQHSQKPGLAYRRIHLDDASTNVPVPKSEYMDSETDQAGLAAALAHVRKAGFVVTPQRRTTFKINNHQ
ncbi:hypothetical protein XANCAGTX0491_001533 [Xanthoria calcicola]